MLTHVVIQYVSTFVWCIIIAVRHKSLQTFRRAQPHLKWTQCSSLLIVSVSHSVTFVVREIQIYISSHWPQTTRGFVCYYWVYHESNKLCNFWPRDYYVIANSLYFSTNPFYLYIHTHTWRVQIQKPLSAVWNCLLKWAFFSGFYV